MQPACHVLSRNSLIYDYSKNKEIANRKMMRIELKLKK